MTDRNGFEMPYFWCKECKKFVQPFFEAERTVCAECDTGFEEADDEEDAEQDGLDSSPLDFIPDD